MRSAPTRAFSLTTRADFSVPVGYAVRNVRDLASRIPPVAREGGTVLYAVGWPEGSRCDEEARAVDEALLDSCLESGIEPAAVSDGGVADCRVSSITRAIRTVRVLRGSVIPHRLNRS